MKEYTSGEVKYKLATANEAIGEMALTYINELEQINFRLQGENKQLKIDYNNLEKENAEIIKNYQVSRLYLEGYDDAKKKAEKEISELKEQNIKDCENFNKTMKEIKEQWNKEHYQLIKAKELLNDFLLMAKVEHLKERYETVSEAEQFLKESE